MSNLPLSGLTVAEFGGLAPGPFAGLILADWGAQVVRIDKPHSPRSSELPHDVLARGKRSIAIDPKVPSGLCVVKKLICKADVLIDPFRPGVMERMGLGPDVFLGQNGLNQRLIYARLVGFSRGGPHGQIAGHDLNYLALSGVLSILPGRPDRPSFPLNLLADFAGGGLTCALGILLALYERFRSGKGQVVDNDMVSATRYISSFALISAFTSSGPASAQDRPPSSVPNKDASITSRMQNTLDDGAPFYTIYTCADGRWFSVACLEPKFYHIFLETFLHALPERSKRGWVPIEARQYQKDEWPQAKIFFQNGFNLYPRDHWEKVFEGKDACAVPVLSPSEAAALSTSDASPRPHPNLSRTPARISPTIPMSASADTYWLRPGQHTDQILQELGVSTEERHELIQDGALGEGFRSLAKL